MPLPEINQNSELLMEIIFHPKALIEFRESFLWYNEQKAGLGERFEAAIENTLQRIANHPEYYTVTRNGFRQAIAKAFSFVISL